MNVNTYISNDRMIEREYITSESYHYIPYRGTYAGSRELIINKSPVTFLHVYYFNR